MVVHIIIVIQWRTGFFKIFNFSKLPNTLNDIDTTDVCLFVKDVDAKSRDYEKTVRKYDHVLAEKNLKSLIKQVC